MARPHRIQVYRAPNRRWYWRRLAGNHRVVAASEQGFRTRWYAKRDARREVPAHVEDGPGYTLEVLA